MHLQCNICENFNTALAHTVVSKYNHLLIIPVCKKCRTPRQRKSKQHKSKQHKSKQLSPLNPGRERRSIFPEFLRKMLTN